LFTLSSRQPEFISKNTWLELLLQPVCASPTSLRTQSIGSSSSVMAAEQLEDMDRQCCNCGRMVHPPLARHTCQGGCGQTLCTTCWSPYDGQCDECLLNHWSEGESDDESEVESGDEPVQCCNCNQLSLRSWELCGGRCGRRMCSPCSGNLGICGTCRVQELTAAYGHAIVVYDSDSEQDPEPTVVLPLTPNSARAA
jgi:hypothetical protein